MVGDRIGVRARGVRDGDATTAGRLDVDRLGAHSVSGDDLELGRRIEMLVGDRVGAGDPCVGPVQQGAQLVEIMVGRPAQDAVSRLRRPAHQVEVAVGEGAARDEDHAHQRGLPANHGASAV